MAITYNNLYLDIRQVFRDSGIEAATLEARELVARHLAGEPVAYLIGEWEFYGLPLDISESVLIPRADTEVLAAQAIDYVRTLDKPRVLDLCAGSGCVGLAIASQVKTCHVVLGEIDEGALRI